MLLPRSRHLRECKGVLDAGINYGSLLCWSGGDAGGGRSALPCSRREPVFGRRRPGAFLLSLFRGISKIMIYEIREVLRTRVVYQLLNAVIIVLRMINLTVSVWIALLPQSKRHVDEQ